MQRYISLALAAAFVTVANTSADGALAADPAPDFEHPIYAVRQTPIKPDRPELLAVADDQVPIDHAGEFDFNSSAVELGVAKWVGGQGANARARLWFNSKGQPLQCEILSVGTGWHWIPSQEWDLNAFSGAICREFMAKAKFTFAPWFSAPMRKGFLERHFELTRWLTPDLPVRFVSREEGHPVELRVGPEADEGGCTISWLRIAQKEKARAVCDAFKLTAEAKRLRELKSRSATVHLIAYVPGVLSEIGAVGIREASSGGKYLGIYPIPKIDDELRLSPSDGRFSAPLDLHELPIDAEDGFSGRVKILLGVGPDGRIISCQPIGSDTNPSVDNATCAQVVKSGKFTFTVAPKWKGKRFWVQSIRWNTED